MLANIECIRTNSIELLFGIEGRRDWAKFTFPVIYGQTVQARWNKYLFDFDMNGSLKRISGRPPCWPNSLEQMKRSVADKYIYYGIFGYESTYYMLKNYYVPFNGVSDPPLFNEQPFDEPHTRSALAAFDRFIIEAASESEYASSHVARDFLKAISVRDRNFLAREASHLRDINGASIPVLPPDTLMVDYEVVPLYVSDGCLYGCGFCEFGDNAPYSVRSRSDIISQLHGLKSFFGNDMINYNSLLLGQNDALAAGGELVEFAALSAYEILDFDKSYHRGAFLFMFASADSLLDCDERFFAALNRSPFETFINVGLESPLPEALEALGKPLSPARVTEAFHRAGEINSRHNRVTVTTNFVLGNSLPAGHVDSILSLLSSAPAGSWRDTVYLSPLIGDCDRLRVRDEFTDIKRRARQEVYIYTVQSL